MEHLPAIDLTHIDLSSGEHAQNSMAAVSAESTTVCILIGGLNSSCWRARAHGMRSGPSDDTVARMRQTKQRVAVSMWYRLQWCRSGRKTLRDPGPQARSSLSRCPPRWSLAPRDVSREPPPSCCGTQLLPAMPATRQTTASRLAGERHLKLSFRHPGCPLPLVALFPCDAVFLERILV
jgi:hypothetical protein